MPGVAVLLEQLEQLVAGLPDAGEVGHAGYGRSRSMRMTRSRVGALVVPSAP